MRSKYSFRHSVCSGMSLAAFGIVLIIVVLVYQPVRIEGKQHGSAALRSRADLHQ
jgi:hypothetical protein